MKNYVYILILVIGAFVALVVTGIKQTNENCPPIGTIIDFLDQKVVVKGCSPYFITVIFPSGQVADIPKEIIK